MFIKINGRIEKASTAALKTLAHRIKDQRSFFFF